MLIEAVGGPEALVAWDRDVPQWLLTLPQRPRFVDNTDSVARSLSKTKRPCWIWFGDLLEICADWCADEGRWVVTYYGCGNEESITLDASSIVPPARP